MEIRETGRKNRKDKYLQPNGLYPYVRLVHATGQVYERAAEFIAEVEFSIEAARLASERRRQTLLENNSKHPGAVKSIEQFRQDLRYGGDGNRVDLAYAVHALSHGIPENEVRAAIGSRDLRHKGTDKRQAEYIDRTIEKALRTVGQECRSR